VRRFNNIELALAQPTTKGERPIEEDLGFVLYRRKPLPGSPPVAGTPKGP
jgi:hypothetical protein